MKGFDSEQAASESCALLPFFSPSVTQFARDSFPVGIAPHKFVLFRKFSSTAAPVEHHANVRSDAQNWPSLLADVQMLNSRNNK
jgi:hypothetical protein